MFVQPDSAQECLLGMNAIPFLGLVMTRSNGETLWSPPNSVSEELWKRLISLVLEGTCRRGRYIVV